MVSKQNGRQIFINFDPLQIIYKTNLWGYEDFVVLIKTNDTEGRKITILCDEWKLIITNLLMFFFLSKDKYIIELLDILFFE